MQFTFLLPAAIGVLSGAISSYFLARLFEVCRKGEHYSPNRLIVVTQLSSSNCGRAVAGRVLHA